MVRALVIKELRECLPLAAIAVAAAAWILLISTDPPLWLVEYTGGRDPQPFLASDPVIGLPIVAGGLAILLGLKQTWWDDFRGAYYYLLHRPVSRTRLFLTKFAVGIGVVQAIGAAMILIYSAWAAMPGTHASPFFWAMTLPAWQAWLAMPVAYVGAALSGLRPARWYGSRLLPLVACVGVAVMLGVLPYLWMTLVGLAIALAVTLPSVLYVAATRDY
jgi:hypothetical protein